MLGNFACLFRLILPKMDVFKKKSCGDIIRVVNSLDRDKHQRIVGSWFGPNCFLILVIRSYVVGTQ